MATKRAQPVLFRIGGIEVHKPRGPNQYFNEITAGQALFPLLILFALNAVDELDRTAFGVLGPDIRDYFGLSNQQFLSIVALTLLGGLLLEVPLAYYSDRLPRARIAVAGAAVWALFTGLTGLSFTVWVLIIARSGAGMGRAVVNPTHNSLLPDVFRFHRMGNAVGAFVGPVVAGILAHFYGWRVPFLVFVIPTLVFVVIGLRLKEPGRGHFERAAMGASAAVI